MGLQCGGGLYFSTGAEFVAAVDWLLSHPDQRHQMGEQGQAYVRRKYSWPAVLDRFKAATSLWTKGQSG